VCIVAVAVAVVTAVGGDGRVHQRVDYRDRRGRPGAQQAADRAAPAEYLCAQVMTTLFGPAKTACGNDYLCTAQRGYDGPAGLGTPNGTGAF
jgi:hypothetical protein